MRHIQNFNDYQKVDEGWKENIIATAALIGSYFAGAAQTKAPEMDVITKDSIGREIRTYRLEDSSYVNQFLREGWKLKAVEVDTIWNQIKEKAPQTQVVVTRIKYDKSNFFESGKFYSLSEQFKQDVDSVINKMSNDKDVLVRVDIVSSTDKQALSPNLKQVLGKLGFTPDNQGLSKARSESVKSYLTQKGISDTIVEVKNLYEQGSKEVETESRYVYVDFYYLEKAEKPGTPSQRTIKDIKKTYVMQKDVTPSQPQPGEPEKLRKKIHINLPTIHIGPIFKHDNRGSMKCPW